jgi:hypothetical protein
LDPGRRCRRRRRFPRRAIKRPQRSDRLKERYIGDGFPLGWTPSADVFSSGSNGIVSTLSTTGQPRRPPSQPALRSHVSGSIAFSPDAKSFLYTRLYGPPGHFRSRLMLLDLQQRRPAPAPP